MSATWRSARSTRSCSTRPRASASRPRSRRSPRGCPTASRLQLYVQGTPLELEELLADETHRCEQAAGAAEDIGEHERAKAIRRLGIAQEQSIRTDRADGRAAAAALPRRVPVAAARRRALLMRRGSRRALRVKADVHERAHARLAAPQRGRRADLEAMGLPARPLDGREVLDLLHGRFDPDARGGGRAARELHAPGGRRGAASPARTRRGAATARSALARGDLHRADRPRATAAHLRSASTLEQVFYVSLAPEQTWLGLAASHDAGAAPVHAQRAYPGDRALPRADGAEAPLQAAVRRQPRRRAARAPARPRRAGWPRRRPPS